MKLAVWQSPNDSLLYVAKLDGKGRVRDVVDGPYPNDREGRAEAEGKRRLHVELAAERRLAEVNG